MENEQSEARKLKYSVSTPLGSQEHSSATDEGPMGPTGVHAHWGHGSGAEAGTWGASQGRPFCFAETAGKAEDPVTLSYRDGVGGAVQSLCDSVPHGGSRAVLTRLF